MLPISYSQVTLSTTVFVVRHSAHILSFVLQAALLHDTVEDTDTTPAELEAKFGPIVARIVQEVTDDKSLPKQERKRQQVEHAPHCSHQAKLVKLADKLYNLRDLNRCTPVGQQLFLSLLLVEIHKNHYFRTYLVIIRSPPVCVCVWQVGRRSGSRSISFGPVRW